MVSFRDGVALAAVGWWISPIVTFLLNKLLSYLYDASEKLIEMRSGTMRLKFTLDQLLEQRMLIELSEGETKVKNPDNLLRDLKNALYEAEEILDLIDYHRIEKEVGDDSKTSWLQWCWQCIYDSTRQRSAPLLQRVKEWLCWLWQWLRVAGETSAPLLQQVKQRLCWIWQWLRVAGETSAPLLQRVKQRLCWLWQWLRVAGETSAPLLQQVKQRLCWLWQWLCVAGGRSAPLMQRVHQRLCSLWQWVKKSAPLLQLARQGLCWLWQCVHKGSDEVLPLTSTASFSLVQRISLWCRSFDFKNFCSCIFNWLSKAIEGARYYRDWSFDQFGFTRYQQAVGMESNCTIMGPLYIKLKKNMGKVEHLIDEAQKIISLKKNLQETMALPNQSRRSKSGTYISNVTTGERQGLGLHIHSNANWSYAVAANSRAAVTTATPPSVVMGRDKDCDKIIAMLHEREEDGQPNTNSAPPVVIGIHGIAGSGKSTLLQLVCAREKKDIQAKTVGHFDLIMWVHVSQDFSVDTIFKEMFEAATGRSCPHFNNLDTLQSNLEKELHGKRFLLVLDDVWYNDRDTMQKILLPLNAGKTGSKILVTSRNENALLALGAAKRRCIPISFLDDDVFLNLFMHCALHSPPTNDLVRIELEDIGKEIAKKLKGLPLAAKIVGGQLYIRQNVEFWRKVRDRNLWNETKGALWWSYQLLDEEVRRCFAYCSVFPRRRLLERDELVKLWAAQGFAGERMEDVCQDYFDELVSVSFLQLRAKEYPDQNDYYVIHDLLYDLAEKVTGSDCFRIENPRSPEVKIPPDVCHIFLQTYDAALITEKICKLDNLRTLIIEEGECVEEDVLKSMFERLRKLRVLIMTCTGFNQMCRSKRISVFPPISQFSIPASIGQLKHLRYLAFRSRGIDEQIRLVLPGALIKLYHMQVLDFSCIEDVVFSSWEGIFGLINLRHLISTQILDIPNIGRLTSLQSMRYFAARKEQGYELKQLGSLNKLSGSLCIIGLENVESHQEALEANLADKEGLRRLKLYWYGEASPEVQAEVLEGLCPPTGLESLTIVGYEGLRFPSWMVRSHNGGPKHLKYLEFSGWVAEPGPELRGFCTHLRVLTIARCSWQALPDWMEHLASLQTLQIYYCMNIQSLPTLPPSLPLQTLQIYYCMNIQSLPTLPPSLPLFIMEYCNEVLMRSCITVGDPYWRKIQHIPYAQIGGRVLEMGVVQDHNIDEMQESGSDSSSSE